VVNIEWGQIDPKGNRRVKQKRCGEEVFSNMLLTDSWHILWGEKRKKINPIIFSSPRGFYHCDTCWRPPTCEASRRKNRTSGSREERS